MNRITEQESDATEKTQSTLALLNAVTNDALEQALIGIVNWAESFDFTS